MGGGRIGEMVFGDPPGSFSSMNVVDQMALERSLRQTRERIRRQEVLQQFATTLTAHIENKTAENKGEHDD